MAQSAQRRDEARAFVSRRGTSPPLPSTTSSCLPPLQPPLCSPFFRFTLQLWFFAVSGCHMPCHSDAFVIFHFLPLSSIDAAYYALPPPCDAAATAIHVFRHAYARGAQSAQRDYWLCRHCWWYCLLMLLFSSCLLSLRYCYYAAARWYDDCWCRYTVAFAFISISFDWLLSLMLPLMIACCFLLMYAFLSLSFAFLIFSAFDAAMITLLLICCWCFSLLLIFDWFSPACCHDDFFFWLFHFIFDFSSFFSFLSTLLDYCWFSALPC